MKLNKKEDFKKESDCALAADVFSVHKTTLDLVFRARSNVVLNPSSCIWETQSQCTALFLSLDIAQYV